MFLKYISPLVSHDEWTFYETAICKYEKFEAPYDLVLATGSRDMADIWQESRLGNGFDGSLLSINGAPCFKRSKPGISSFIYLAL